MPLLSEQDAQILKQHLSAIDKRVTLLLFTQAIGGSDSGRITKQVLDEIAQLNDNVTIEERNFILDVDDRTKYGVDKSPAIVILADDKDTRMRLFGAPTGYEFVGLVEAIHLAGTGQLDLQDDTLKLLATVDKPTSIQVFSTPT